MSGWVSVGQLSVPCSEPPVFVGGPGRPDLGDEILRLVRDSCKSLTVVNPLLTEPALVDALLAARRRRVQVRVITELRENRGSGIRYPTRGFEHGAAAELGEHFAVIRRLAGELVFCRGPRHYAHAKLLLSDDRVLMVSSANGTPNSLGRGLSPAIEAGVRVTDAETVSGWVTALRRLWDACPFRLRAQEDDVSLQQESGTPLHGSELESAPTASWSYPTGHRGIRDRLTRLIAASRRRVILAALSFYDTNQIPALHGELVAALERGVEILVLVRPEEFRPDRYPDLSTRGLIGRGLRLHGVTGLHAKGVVADDTACGIFSANVNPFSLESDLESAHIEAGLFENAPFRVLASYARFLEDLAANRTHEYRP